MSASAVGRTLSYAAQLQLALLGLAIPAVVFAALGWHVLEESKYRVERGRIASDIYSSLVVFDLDKTRLRNWSYRQTLDQGADPQLRIDLLARMRAQIVLVADMADLAAELDRQRGKILPEHAQRRTFLAVLEQGVDKLDRDTGLMSTRRAGSTSQVAAIDAEFGQVAGVTLADALGRAAQDEAAALGRERVRASQSLAAARRLFLSAGGFALVATLAMAILFAHRLRQPLRQLDEGLQAFKDGDFSYRFDTFRDTEFATLGRQLNAMATEVGLARARSVKDRVELEWTVAARTAELRRTVDELAASEGARHKLLADIGHELRTPVTVIRGEAQVALRLKAADAPAYRAALERIVGVSRQMAHLIEDLLVLVRDPSGQPVIAAREMRLAEALLPALETARSIAAQREVALHGPEPLPEVDLRADPDRLRQILVCLIDNALRYSHPGGEVRLTVERHDAGQVTIEIADRGIGVEPGDLGRLFDRGWRSERARRHRPDGLGLGLAIARQLTEAQGGDLVIRQGRGGVGVTARLSLPVAGDVARQEGGLHGDSADRG